MSMPVKRMHTVARLAAISAVVTTAWMSMTAVRAVTIDWVTVGDPGNAPDPAGLGAVGYTYRIAKHEVTIQQYTDFLNAVAATDPHELYHASMALNLNIAGIARSGTSGSYTYSVIDNGGSSGNRPITYVSWFDAARFANWLHNGGGAGGTETGAYTLVGGQTRGTAPARNPGATSFLPTENEWYKAAFYSPVKNGPGSPGSYAYATQSDVAPGNTIGGAAGQANYYAGTFAVTQSPSHSSVQNYLTDVGAFSASGSYYGTFDQSGNVYEWNDRSGAAEPSRGIRGGSWASTAINVSYATHGMGGPEAEFEFIGFRLASPVAAVPEPSTWVMGAGGLTWAAWGARRRRHSAGRSA